ncbi:hypothetical protein ACIP79_17290 [Streptomyces sp. NPDC088747]|uniref:hypothetical protein n=1 Tax=Streptomyces sp. NPDC088747 TaxID=3365886 RepID=UPI00382B246D
MIQLPARIAVAATAVLLALCSAACSADSGPSGAPDASGDPPAPVTPARLSDTLPDDPVRMALPATGAETRWTQGLATFGQQTARAAATACASERGIALPEQVPLAYIRFSELPDLDFLARHGFSQSAEVPTPAARPVVARTAGAAAVRRCQAQGAAAADELSETYASLQSKWFDALAALRTDPAVRRATQALPDCFAGQGLRVRNENGFFALVDANLNSAAPTELPYVDRELGNAYATCMRPVEAVREPARLRLRTRFLTEHPTEVTALRTNLVPSLHDTEKRLGIRLAFPAP